MLDLTKPVKTRDGQSIRIVTTDGLPPFNIIGYVGDDTDPVTWTENGRYQGEGIEHEWDLINVRDEGLLETGDWIQTSDGSIVLLARVDNLLATVTQCGVVTVFDHAFEDGRSRIRVETLRDILDDENASLVEAQLTMMNEEVND